MASSRKDLIAEKPSGALGKGHELSGDEQTEENAEQVAEEDADEKGGDGHDHLIRHGDDPVKQAAFVLGGQDPQGDGEDHQKDEGQQRQGKGHGEFVGQHLGDGHGVGVGGAEIPAQEVPDPLKIPHVHRPVEAHGVPQGSQGFRGGVGAQLCRGRVAGDDLESQEGEKGNNQQCNNESDDFLYDVFHDLAFLSYGLIGCAGDRQSA